MKKLLIITSALALGFLAACTPAQSVSGTYTGTYSGSGMPVNSGNATVVISENGANNVHMVIQSSGNPDYTASNVTVVRTSIFGITYYSFNLNNYPWTVNGDWFETSRELDFTLTNDTSFFNIHFTGIK